MKPLLLCSMCNRVCKTVEEADKHTHTKGIFNSKQTYSIVNMEE